MVRKIYRIGKRGMQPTEPEFGEVSILISLVWRYWDGAVDALGKVYSVRH